MRVRRIPLALVSLVLSAMFGAGACGSDGSGEGASSGVDGGGFVEGGSSILLPSDAAPDGPVPSPFGLDQRPANPTCKAGPRPSTGATLKFEPVYPNLAGRVAIMGTFKAPGNRAFWYALLRNGLVQRFDDRPDVTDYSPVLDIQDIVSASGEGGLLGLAFHPDWATNRTAFLYYTVPSAEKLLDKSVLARIRSTDGGLTFDRSTLEPLLELDQPFDNHKGGTIAFGPDGELYMAFGDGGGAGDTLRTSQDRSQLLGKVIRIHVGTTGPYTVPADNPFVGVAGTRPEIWAIGFRNPYRWSFDRATGAMMIGDVGEALREEVDRVEKGGNYGWSEREGTLCYNRDTAGCVGDGSFVEPLFDYPHKAEYSFGAAIVGGFVYRGKRIPELYGAYVFSDYFEGRMYWARENAAGTWALEGFFETPGLSITSLAEDEDGEIYGLDYGIGQIVRVARSVAPASPVVFPDRLSQTGCFDAADPKRPAPALVPYDVNSPFWSDGAEKSRWFALPDGKTITVSPEGDFDLPPGSVTAKEFRIDGRRIETRLFVRHDDGEWAGYSYAWNAEETEATRVIGGGEVKVGATTWRFPSEGQCLTCHTAAAGRTLGLELAQLAKDHVYLSTGRISPQLDTLAHVGLIPPPGSASPLADPFGTESVQSRARSYLHSNCSHCHRSGGPGRGNFSLLRGAPNAGAGCGVGPVAGELGRPGALVIAPGDPDLSLVVHRASTRGAYGMPPVGPTSVDARGVALLRTWIGGLDGCSGP